MNLGEIVGLEGKVAVVLGGGQGNGEATCLAFAAAGADVAVVDLDIGRAENVAEQVRAMGRRAHALTGDVRNKADCECIMQETADALGVPDRLVTIIGQATYSTLLDMSEEAWDRDMAINLKYFLLAGQVFARQLIAAGKGGAIAAIASIDGVLGAPQHAAYGAAKAGLIHLVRSMAVEWAEYGIRVNACAPGSIVTPRIPDSEGRRQMMRESIIPLGRSGQPHEIAGPLLFLCSDLSSYMTGQVLLADGGWSVGNLFDARRSKPGSDRPTQGTHGEQF